ncbi:hypothetical protein, partial [Streptomyces pulveraceus]
MGNKRKAQRQRDTARARAQEAQQQRLAAEELFAENHARLVVQRQGDPRFVQRAQRPDGTIEVSWAAGTELDARLSAALRGQLAAFEEKFGRPPSTHDPIFFDPDADEPRPLTQASISHLMDEMADIADQTGVDPAYVHAWRACGYIVTADNRHTFSAAEVQAFSDAVHAYKSQAGARGPITQTTRSTP